MLLRVEEGSVALLHRYFDWVQNTWGVDHTVYGRSFSAALHESLNFWGLLEGTHLLTVMLFFGTIMIVDLRLLGVVFKSLPISVVSKRLLPLTIFSMLVLFVTGALLFFAKPQDYFHNIWFRAKMVALVLAMLNIYTFHNLVEKSQHEWDTATSPPTKAKVSAALSLLSWLVVIAFGRFIAYNWFECGKPHWHWMNVAQDCKASSLGALEIENKTSASPPAPVTAAPVAAPAPTPAPDAPATQPEAKQ